jgi:GH18 family chitinase
VVQAAKSSLIDNDLGGVMFWELSGDDRQNSLLDALHKGLTRKK